MPYLKYGKIVATARDHGDEIPTIPAAVYILKFNPMQGFYLEQQDDLVRAGKIYGGIESRAAQILNTFFDRPQSTTGVLLSGNKGSGKTMLTKEVSMMAVNAGLPVILIEEAFSGIAFTQFMNSITQPCVILMDEFEKKYKEADDQNALLSLLDGTGVGGKLYLLTSNSALVSEFLISRPSRIFYHFKYTKLEKEMVVGYCEDNLDNKEHLPRMISLWGISLDMSFDVMQCLVEELNRYPEISFADSLTNLNISLGASLRRLFSLKKATINGVKQDSASGREYVNLGTFIEGDSKINAHLDIEDYEKQKALRVALGTEYCYFRNHDLLDEEKAGKEVDMDNFEESFTFRLNYSANNTVFTADVIIFEHEIAGDKYVFHWEAEERAPDESFIQTLFA